MSTWMNSDGLFVKFGSAEADTIKGGHRQLDDGRHVCEFIVDYTDALSATSAVLGSASASNDGSFGVTMPEGARIEAVEVIAEAAFTSSGTIGSATLEMGLKKASDRSTALDEDAFTTTSFVAGVLDAVGERTYVVPGVTGAGSGIGTTLTENGVVCLRNSAHASHPYTAGKARVRVFYYFP